MRQTRGGQKKQLFFAANRMAGVNAAINISVINPIVEEKNDGNEKKTQTASLE